MEQLPSKITVNYEKCTGCRGCEMVCSLNMWGECNPNRAAIRNIRDEKAGIVSTIPVLCQQCQEAICEAVCPVQAITRSQETGALVVDDAKCLGCRRCVYSCPFGGASIDTETRHSSKCNLCDGDPQCVKMCPKDALSFVRIDNIGVDRKRRSIDRYVQFLNKPSEVYNP